MAAPDKLSEEITVELGDRSYPIVIGRGIVDRLPELLARTGAAGAIGVVTDSHVGPLYGGAVEECLRSAGYTPVIVSMEAGERNKLLARIEEFTGRFLEAGLDRSSAVVALGGGVVGDTAGFAAAVYMRGIPYVQVPTTIVAQVDSSVGGKTAVNHPLSKNIMGAFHQPAGVLIDLELLASLPDRELRAGLAEAIKHGIIADPDLFAYMESHAAEILAMDLEVIAYPVRRSCEIKAAVVAEDEREHGRRADLNYGHTFGHAIEAASGYDLFLHGEAIAIGMHAAATLSRDLGLVDQAFVERQRACLEDYGLPVTWRDVPMDETLAAMQRDKKARTGTLKFVVADRLGHVIHRTDVTEAQIRSALEAVRGGA